jgi:uncharacterized protein YacL
LMILLLVIQIGIEPFWMLLVATTRHYGTAVLHTVESLVNLLLSLWWVQKWGLSGVIAGTVVARILTTGWYIPMTAMRIMEADLSDILSAPRAPLLIAVTSGALGCLLLAIRVSIIPALPIPITAAFFPAVFALVLAYAVFSRDERKAALSYASVVLQGRRQNGACSTKRAEPVYRPTDRASDK